MDTIDSDWRGQDRAALEALSERLSLEKDVRLLEVYHELLRREPERVDYLVAVGDFYMTQADPDRARPYFESARALAPEGPGILRELGHCYLAGGLFEEARAVYARARAIDPDNPHWPRAVADTFLAEERPDLARPHLEEAFALGGRPDDLAVLKSLGDPRGRARLSARLLEANILDLVRYCRSEGVSLCVLTYPAPGGDERDLPANRSIRRAAAGQAGVFLFDLERSETAQLFRQDGTFLSGDRWHPSEAGYRKMAEYIFGGLEHAGVI